MQVALSQIRPLESSWGRRDIVASNVESLVSCKLVGVPPILLTEHYELIDGYHRVEAAKELKLSSIEAEIHSFPTTEDKIEAAYQANINHGLTAGKEDRASYIQWMTLYRQSLTSHQMAERAGVSVRTVQRALKKLDQDSEDEGIKDETGYNRPDTKKLVATLTAFREKERALIGQMDGKRSIEKRAKALVAYSPRSQETYDFFKSMSDSFLLASQMLTKK